MEMDYGFLEEEVLGALCVLQGTSGQGATSLDVAALFPCSIDLSSVKTRTQAEQEALAQVEVPECSDAAANTSRRLLLKNREFLKQDSRRRGTQRQEPRHKIVIGTPREMLPASSFFNSTMNSGKRGKRGKSRTYGDGMMIFYEQVRAPP
jgi:hypothetical protein